MRISAFGHHGLFQMLCQVSATWFSFRFISKNKIKWKKIKTVTKIHSWKSTKWKQNENKWKQKQNKQNKKNEKKNNKIKKRNHMSVLCYRAGWLISGISRYRIHWFQWNLFSVIRWEYICTIRPTIWIVQNMQWTEVMYTSHTIVWTIWLTEAKIVATIRNIKLIWCLFTIFLEL